MLTCRRALGEGNHVELVIVCSRGGQCEELEITGSPELDVSMCAVSLISEAYQIFDPMHEAFFLDVALL